LIVPGTEVERIGPSLSYMIITIDIYSNREQKKKNTTGKRYPYFLVNRYGDYTSRLWHAQ